MHAPRVSVLMPAYRHERYVGAAIESVLAQTIEDWELIVIDDCSPDATWERIRDYRDPRITALRQEINCGAHATLNACSTRARGRYRAILNSDDVYAPARLERTIGCLESTGADLVGTGVRLIDGEGAPVGDPAHPWMQWYSGRRAMLRETGDLVAALLGGNLFVTTSNFVFRRELVERIGGFEDLRYAHDYAFVLSAIAVAESRVMLLADESLLDYRWHGSNTIREESWKVALEEFAVVCRYLPRCVPEAATMRVDSGLRHLAALSPICPDAQSSELVRLEKEGAGLRSHIGWLESEADRLRDYAGRLEAEAATLRDYVGRLEAEAATLRDDAAGWKAVANDLRNEIQGLRGSYSFRLGSALLAPVRRARAFLGRGR